MTFKMTCVLQLRESLVWGKHEAYDVLHDLDDENNDAEGDSDIMDSTEQDDTNLTQNINFDAEVPLNNGKVCMIHIIPYITTSNKECINDDKLHIACVQQSADTSEFNGGEAFGKNDVDTEKSLEDLCRSHLVMMGNF